MLKNIRFKGGFFSDETELPLFENRISLVYGKNGSGKSTISKAVSKAKGDIVDDIIYASLYDENNTRYEDYLSIHVFNEEYVNSHVKIKEDGLNSIVLLGELGALEDDIINLKGYIEEESKRNQELQSVSGIYKDHDNVKSPWNCRLQINLGLSGDGHWAEREKIINEGKRNSSVTEKVIDSIVGLQPSESLETIRVRYANNLNLLNQIRNNGAKVINEAEKLNINYDAQKLYGLLGQKVERPILSDRERYLLQLIDDGKLDQINDMKKVFSVEKTVRCPFCFRPIASREKSDLVDSIEKVLSKEVDIHEEQLRTCIIPEVSINSEQLTALNFENYGKCKASVDEINQEIFKIREAVMRKINHPYTPITEFYSDLEDKLNSYEDSRIRLQEEIDSYNNAVKRIEGLKRSLTADNALMAHYDVSRDIELWKQAVDEQNKVETELKHSDGVIEECNKKLERLKAQKKNIKIAVDLINRSLRYVFFSKDRLEIKIKGEKYILYAHSKPVKPNNVSVGERNIIALCYFFTELIMNQEVKDGYSRKLTLVIDDPVSSFDLENKVGIMSLLKSKISDIVMHNEESQVLIMTHDLQCMYDFLKIGDEISGEYKAANNGKKKELYSRRELKNKELVPFKYKTRNEYSELFKRVYAYACGESDGEDIVVGNSMRRVMEAYSTFVYKKNIAEVSCDPLILQKLEDKDYIDYFKNLMYRLVLNGESHMEERTKGLESMDYLDLLDDEQRRRTAQEVICFLYLLNEQHVLAHLDGMKDVKKTIKHWCNQIKVFYNDDAVQ